MTQTLTTKALRALRDSLKSWQDGYDPVDDKEQYEMFVTAETAVGELLANREAQPVAWGYEWASCITCDGPQNFKHVIEREAPPKWAIDEGQARNVTPLYTAPPAPAVPDERHAFESFVAQQFGEAVDRRRAKNGDNEYMAWDMAVAWIVWQRRAAMLATAPEGETSVTH